MKLLTNISTELEKSITDYFSKKYILAVSGGIDSMVLLDCFNKLNLNFEVAHYNFQLRGEESNEDEKLVSSVCSSNKIALHINTYDTNSFAKENNLSIQEAARELRYKWFYKLLAERKADYIVTAHHADDSIETFFINLLRGSGIKGLCGITNNNQIIRPFLSVWKKEIEEYALSQNIEYRNDSSNESLKYKRNFIRKKIIPELNKEQEGASRSISKSIRHLNQVNKYLSQKLTADIQKIVSKNGETISINTKHKVEDIVLYSALVEFGFNESQVNSIQNDISAIGKKYHTASHELLIDRNKLEIRPTENNSVEEFLLSTVGNYNNPIAITIKEVERPHSLVTEPNTVFIDADKIQFPLIIRKWKDGDWFIPFGMKGKKKLSDFFIDNKISRFEKDNTWIILSANQVIWVVNHRLDDRYKVRVKTKNVLQVVTNL